MLGGAAWLAAVWSGQTRSVNPKDVRMLVQEIAGVVRKEMQKQGLIS